MTGGQTVYHHTPQGRRSNCSIPAEQAVKLFYYTPRTVGSSVPACRGANKYPARRTGGQTVLLYPAEQAVKLLIIPYAQRVICASLQRGQQITIPCPQNRRSNCSIILRTTGGQTVDYTPRTAGHLCQPAEGPTNYNTLPAEQAVKLFYYTPHNRRSNCLYPAHSGSSVPVRRRYNICRIDGQSVLVWLVRRLYIRTQAVKLC
jgi:hypothetical protein